jgi:hypothetical protein
MAISVLKCKNEAGMMIDDLITPVEVNVAHDCTGSEIPGDS